MDNLYGSICLPGIPCRTKLFPMTVVVFRHVVAVFAALYALCFVSMRFTSRTTIVTSIVNKGKAGAKLPILAERNQIRLDTHSLHVLAIGDVC